VKGYDGLKHIIDQQTKNKLKRSTWNMKRVPKLMKDRENCLTKWKHSMLILKLASLSTLSVSFSRNMIREIEINK